LIAPGAGAGPEIIATGPGLAAPGIAIVRTVPMLIAAAALLARTDIVQSAAGSDRSNDPTVRRNAPCPCGSGRRYKHCHGAT
jgi:preprotein translocase subunit SecA